MGWSAPPAAPKCPCCKISVYPAEAVMASDRLVLFIIIMMAMTIIMIRMAMMLVLLMIMLPSIS